MQMTDLTFHSVLDKSPHTLRALHIQDVDLSKVRPWSFALLAKFECLEELYILESVLPLNTESLLARMLSPSFETLTNVSLTDSEQVRSFWKLSIVGRVQLWLQTLKNDAMKFFQRDKHKQYTNYDDLLWISKATRVIIFSLLQWSIFHVI